MIEKDDGIGVRTYLTAEEAKDFHKLFMMSFIIFTVIAIVAHFLVWQWRPWLPGPDGYKTPVTTASVVTPATATHS
jgi:light-harvesting complex 1 beta chain